MDQQTTETLDAGNGWKRVISQTICLLPRQGWPGVWDSVVSAVTGNPIKTVPTNLVCSVYVKPAPDGDKLFGMPVEQGCTGKP